MNINKSQTAFRMFLRLFVQVLPEVYILNIKSYHANPIFYEWATGKDDFSMSSTLMNKKNIFFKKYPLNWLKPQTRQRKYQGRWNTEKQEKSREKDKKKKCTKCPIHRDKIKN